jgi:hypothetical protein
MYFTELDFIKDKYMASLKNTIIDDTGHLTLPVGTTLQRPTPANGMIRINITTTPYIFEIYNGAWRTLKVLF